MRMIYNSTALKLNSYLRNKNGLTYEIFGTKDCNRLCNSSTTGCSRKCLLAIPFITFPRYIRLRNNVEEYCSLAAEEWTELTNNEREELDLALNKKRLKEVL